MLNVFVIVNFVSIVTQYGISNTKLILKFVFKKPLKYN
jgi:hypothetical protein